MIRLFVAIDLPDSVARRLVKICSGIPAARWVKQEQMHLTLRFIGEVDGGVFQDICETLAGVHAPPFTLQLDGLGCFPPRGRPRVLWAGLASCPELQHLQKKIESVLVRKADLQREKRKYSPHITLARLNNAPPSRVGRFLEEYGLFLSEPFIVDRFHLYSSVLGKNGAIHTVEESYPLVVGNAAL